MALQRHILTIACVLALLLQAGCASNTTTTTRPSVTKVDLSMEVSPSAGRPFYPVVADVWVKNVGNTRVWHCGGCGCGNGVGLDVLGPDGTRVLLWDPNAPVPLCADGPVPLDPGQELRGRIVFTGTLFVANHPSFPSRTYPAPAGTYTVVGSYGYTTDGTLRDGIPIVQRTTFEWTP